VLGRDYPDLLSPLLSVTREDLRRGLYLFEQFDRLGAFDAVLAASSAAAGASALVSADAAFAELPELRHLVPDAAGIAELLNA
jgi:predicted nucleic acid-binding protein